MNVFKMAIANIKKCVNDYVIYFLTLILGVAIFYIFNSIGDQSIIMEMSESNSEIIELMLFLLEGISVAVSFVLGTLIIYASHFLIRRRKKEFGIYMLWGMRKRDISTILVTETALIGAFSLVIGLVSGILFSQFFSILVGKFFEADMSAYAFTISRDAVGKTILNFVIMYLMVILFHSVAISKYKLIDLLSVHEKIEKQLLKNPLVSTIVCFFAVAVLLVTYYRVGFCPEDLGRKELVLHILSGVVATILLFWSVSGFLISVLRRWEKVYHKNLNAFVIRQFCGSINTSSISMAVICIMLFVTICTFASGFSLAHQMQENIRNVTPVDFSIVCEGQEKVSEVLNQEGWKSEDWAAEGFVEVPVFCCETVTYKESLGESYQAAKEQFSYASWDSEEIIMRLSDYNTLAALYGKEMPQIEEDEYVVVCDFKLFTKFRNEAMADGTVVKIGSNTLKPACSECIDGYLYMSGISVNTGVIIVPDAVIDNSETELLGYVMAGNYNASGKKEKKELDKKLIEGTAKYINEDYTGENSVASMVLGTKISIRESNNGLTMMAAFIVIYVGVVFLVASAALLALKALSESIDSIPKYAVLKKMGGDGRMLKKALFAQIGVYFALPMVVAVMHSIIGLRFAEYALAAYVEEGVYWGVCVTVIVMFILYGSYLLATYNGSKRIVELSEKI